MDIDSEAELVGQAADLLSGSKLPASYDQY